MEIDTLLIRHDVNVSRFHTRFSSPPVRIWHINSWSPSITGEYVLLSFFSVPYSGIFDAASRDGFAETSICLPTMLSFTLNRYDNEFWGQTPKLRWDRRRIVWVYCISSYARTAPHGYDVPCVFSVELMLLHCLQPRYDIIAISQWCKWRAFTCKRGMNKYDALIIPKDHST